MANRDGHRRFGNIRKLPSGRFQIRYPGPDGRLRTGTTTYATKTDAARALTLIEAQMLSGEWTDPDRGKILLGGYARVWIKERPGLRPKTVELYTWLLERHIVPGLGGAAVGKLTTQMIRSWRAELIGNGVSVSTAAKAYRLLRAILMTAVEEDKLISRNPCRIKGADNEQTPERPILTVVQVFELADLVGRSPVGNIRSLEGGYRLRFAQQGQTSPYPETYSTRAAAELTLWRLAADGKADCTHDRRFRALVLLATFASLRWGEVTALRRSDIDLKARTVRVREQLIELDGGEMVLGPPKSRAGKRTVSIPAAIVPALAEHLAEFVEAADDSFVFLGKRGGFLRGGNFRREARWSEALAAMGVKSLHFHDLRHTGNTLAAQSGASLADLKARMGHDSDRAALIYQHATRDADQRIADALSARVEAERKGSEDAPAGR
ncbi:tyrosine-type recombinase/integrase [Microtetraspora fusca]|uniref:Tyrosine-type recombinase/integrase n=1 Tax=Microtetraspora fusca TaxID=1997 RepID=A0ABW6UXJ4_MICFU